MGKNSDPIEISHSKYCKFLNLDVNLSNNVRKTIANDFYGWNYLLTAECRAQNEEISLDTPLRRGLESISKKIYEIVIKEFF